MFTDVSDAGQQLEDVGVWQVVFEQQDPVSDLV